MTTQREIKNLRQRVEAILKDYPKSRDSDQWLTLKLWTIYFPSRIKRDEQGNAFVLLTDIMDLPREDNVKRVRAKIQNEEGKYLPTSLAVAKQRKIEESVWRNYINQN